MQFFQMFAASVVILRSPEGKVEFGGSCGMFMSRDTVLTAAHCVPEGFDAWVRVAGEQSVRQVVRRVVHDTADLAVLHLAPNPEEQLPDGYFLMPGGLIESGDFVGLGFPAEGAPDGRPVARTVKGHFQRMFGYQPPGQATNYFAFEMSVPAPGGLSGTVLAYQENPQVAVAVVTGNIESSVVVDRFEEIRDGHEVYSSKIERVVAYGVAAALHGHRAWLEEAVAAQGT